VESTLKLTAQRQVIRVPYHINDPEFADAAVAVFSAIAQP
jgi:uncharacterized protein (UPF0261 family)